MRRRTGSGTGILERLFSALLRLFPADFQDRFSAEMRMLFRDQRRDARSAGPLAYARFLGSTASGLVATAFRGLWRFSSGYGFCASLDAKRLRVSTMVVAILGLAIGAGTAAFLAANAILIQPLPFPEQSLIHLLQRRPGVGVETPFSVRRSKTIVPRITLSIPWSSFMR